MVVTTECVGQIFNNAINWTGEVTVLDDTNIQCKSIDGGSGSDLVYYLALDLAGTGTDLRTLTTPTSTGDDTINDAGFTPGLLIESLTKADATDTLETDSDANSMQIGASDGTNEFSVCAVDENAAATTNTFSVATANLIDLDDSSSGTAAHLIDSSTSFISGGRTHDYPTVDEGTARLGWELMVETQVVAGGPTAGSLALMGVGI